MSDQPKPEAPKQTEMANPPKAQVKLVKVKLKRDAFINDLIVIASQDAKHPTIVEVSEERAKELCVKRAGNYAFQGARYDDAIRHDASVGERVA